MVTARGGGILTHDEVLRLLFGALQPVLEFDGMAAVLCRNGEDCVTVFSMRPLAAPFRAEPRGESGGELPPFLGRVSSGVPRRPPDVRLLGKEGAHNDGPGAAPRSPLSMPR